MIMTRIYETQEGDLAAAVWEDGRPSNYLPNVEMEAMDADDFMEDARLGFPDALSYELDLMEGGSTPLEKRVAEAEEHGALVAEFGEERAVLYPGRMSGYAQDFFQSELGDELWAAVLERSAHSEGVGLKF